MQKKSLSSKCLLILFFFLTAFGFTLLNSKPAFATCNFEEECPPPPEDPEDPEDPNPPEPPTLNLPNCPDYVGLGIGKGLLLGSTRFPKEFGGGTANIACDTIDIQDIYWEEWKYGASGGVLSAAEKAALPNSKSHFVAIYIGNDLTKLDPSAPVAHWLLPFTKTLVQDVPNGSPHPYTRVVYKPTLPLSLSTTQVLANTYNSKVFVRVMNLMRRDESITGAPLLLRNINHESCIFNRDYHSMSSLVGSNNSLTCAASPPPTPTPETIPVDASGLIISRNTDTFTGEQAIDRIVISRSSNKIFRLKRSVPPADSADLYTAVEGLWRPDGNGDILALRRVATNNHRSYLSRFNGTTSTWQTPELSLPNIDYGTMSESIGGKVVASFVPPSSPLYPNDPGTVRNGLFNIDRESGTITQLIANKTYRKIKLGGNGKLYTVSHTGVLNELDPNTGAVTRTFTVPANTNCAAIDADSLSIVYALCSEGTVASVAVAGDSSIVYGPPKLYRYSPTGVLLDKTTFNNYPNGKRFFSTYSSLQDVDVDAFGNVVLMLFNNYGSQEVLVIAPPTRASDSPPAVRAMLPFSKRLSLGMAHFSPSYCSATTRTASSPKFNSIKFNNSRAVPQVNLWNNGSTVGYQNLGNFLLGLVKGATFTATFTGVTSTYRVRAYADFNGNGDFTDAGESLGTFNGASTVTGSMTIPNSVPIGSSVNMRFVLYANATAAAAGSCGASEKIVDLRAQLN